MSQRAASLTDADHRRILAETFIADVRSHETLASTSDAALALSKQDSVRVPALILADRQTAGRGRGSNRWWSSSGSLTFSILLNTTELHIPLAIRPRISLAAGLAVCDAVDDALGRREAKLKWPNDVLCQGRKICGILADVSPHRQDLLALGIGINVNNSWSDAPPEVRSIATSLVEIAGREISPGDLLVATLGRLQQRLLWVGEQQEQLQQHWQQRCILTGRWVQIELPNDSVTGVCQGIDQEGALVVRTSEGSRRLVSGVIKSWS